MTMDRFKKQFRILKSVAPDAERKAAFRHALEHRVRADMRLHAARASLNERRIGALHRVLHAPSFALAIVIVILGSSGGVAFASQNALPGTSLYTVKLGTEKARLTFTRDERKKAELHITFASRRMHEIEQLINNDSSDNAAITNTVAYYEHELKESESLLAKDQSAAQTVAALITATESHKDALTNLKTKIAERKSEHLTSRLEEAYEHAETHNDAALLTALSSVATSSDAAAFSPAVIETSRKKVRSLEKELAEKKRAIEAAREHNNTDNDDAIAEATSKLESAETIVEKAKSRLEKEEYRESVERSIEARTLMKEASSWEREYNKRKEEKESDDDREHSREESDRDRD